MKFSIKLAVLSLITALAVGCNKEDPPTPAEMLEGQWTMTSQTISAGVGGSYLTFNACSSTCSGIDYKASDATSGAFTYTLNADATLLIIADTDADGGNWNATWDVLELTETSLRITGTTIFGNLIVEFSK